MARLQLFLILLVLLGVGPLVFAQSPADGKQVGDAAARIAQEGWTPGAIGQLVGGVLGWIGLLIATWIANRFRGERNVIIDAVESIPNLPARKIVKRTVTQFANREGHEEAIRKVVRARQVDHVVVVKRRATLSFDGVISLVLVALCFALNACSMGHPSPALTNLINGQVAALEADLEDAGKTTPGGDYTPEAPLMDHAEMTKILAEHLGTFYVFRYGYLGIPIPPEFSEVLAPIIAALDAERNGR